MIVLPLKHIVWTCCFFIMNFPFPIASNQWAVERTASKVLLLAAGRSGSTFVGEMLNQATDSFYLYEPCRSLEGDAGVARFSGKVNVKRCVDLVSRIYDCSFTIADTDMMFEDFKALNKSNLVRFYKVGPQGLVSPQMKHDRHLAFSNACKKASIRAVKEVRVVEADSEAVEEGVVAQLLTSGVRILHLVRDPRGVINSRLQLWQFCKSKGVVKCSPEVCDSYRTSLDAVEKVLKNLFSFTGSNGATSKHYLRIKYEEAAMNPVDLLGVIYEWAGLGKAEPRINQWVFSTTHASTSDNAFKITRNATKVAFQWKTEMPKRQQQIATQSCGDVLVRLDYATKEEVQRIASLPLPPKYGSTTGAVGGGRVGGSKRTRTSGWG